MTSLDGIEISKHPLRDEVFTPEATDFVAALERAFRDQRLNLLRNRRTRQEQFNAGLRPDFLPETAEIRSGTWAVAAPPKDLLDRRVEITGPPERKMMINALNSGARVFMADFEDSSTPTWDNMLSGQVNVRDAFRRELALHRDGKNYTLNDNVATLVVRPRGWHLPERHVQIDGQPAAASLVDFGLVFFHNAKEALDRGTAPYFYLPKLENHCEARLWNEVFCHAQDALNIPRGSIKATVLIETITAAFEMDEILYELREHSAGLNAGRWDYIFSVAKKFNADPSFVLPDRSDVTMTVPFMRAYTELMVATCHKRGAHAIGGMAAFIPNRRDPEITAQALTKVKEDKRREANDGCDGTWVAHPDLVTVAEVEFNAILDQGLNQVGRLRPDVVVSADDLLSVEDTGGRITRSGLETNVYVGLRYLASWLSGSGAAAINNLMEDAATAEISRAQIWQWVQHGRTLEDGVPVTADLVRSTIDAQLATIAEELDKETFASLPFDEARMVFEQVALASEFVEFLTLPAYELLH
ncbi:MAG: malate synthase A [Acidimicrobiaceae bacterium]|mgnify:FL=1|nr:malate synthase A [Acidimicrobiaceae bacterium]HAQ22476.1 malate synthase A [Acidimicrobiaceae bacterium]